MFLKSSTLSVTPQNTSRTTALLFCLKYNHNILILQVGKGSRELYKPRRMMQEWGNSTDLNRCH